MKYLYTTEPDEGCHKIDGVYGRPVHTYEQKTLKAKGWKETADELREEAKEEAKPSGTLAVVDAYFSQSGEQHMAALYEEVIGKKPHHKMKFETMKAKIDEALKDE